MIKNWEELDETTKGKLTMFTSVVLYLNDQVTCRTICFAESIANSNLYRQNVKYITNELKRLAMLASDESFRVLDKSALYMAEVNGNIDNKVGKHLEIYKYAVSQLLLDAGISSDKNNFASELSTINMLAQMLRVTIDKFAERLLKPFGVKNNPLKCLGLERIEYKSHELSNILVGKGQEIDLNKDVRIINAFNCIQLALLSNKTIAKAITKTEEEIEEVKKIANKQS